MAYIQRATVVNAPPESVFSRHATLSGLQQILSCILEIELIGNPIEKLFSGQEIDLYLGFKGISRRCLLKVEEVIPNQRIEIRQIKGLFRSFRYRVQFEDHGGGGALVNDLADYRLPLGIIGHLVDDLFLKAEIEKLMSRRHEFLVKLF